jgi:superfamily II DNA/RNA helicase
MRQSQVKGRSESGVMRSVVGSLRPIILIVEANQGLDPLPKHRVTSSGENVPAPISEFDDLPSRYKIPQRLLQNIQNCGYDTPTGIQAHGIPVLLEVSFLI